MIASSPTSRNSTLPKPPPPPPQNSLSQKAQTFAVLFNGSIDSGMFPFHDDLYCKFSYNMGPEWSVINGTSSGITQQSRKACPSLSLMPSKAKQNVNAWSFPLEIAMKSSNIHGWPQLILQVYGPDMLGRDVVRGYGSLLLPRSTGSHTLYVPVFVPLATSPLNVLLGVVAARRPEFLDAKFVAKADGRDVTRVQSQGVVKVTLNVTMRGLSEAGYQLS